jgi:hypothetical protein
VDDCWDCVADDPNSCAWCDAGFYLSGAANSSNATCWPCAEGCSHCTSASDCTACAYGYYSDADPNDGDQTAITCHPCIEGCSHCTSASECTTCDRNHTLSDDGSRCGEVLSARVVAWLRR